MSHSYLTNRVFNQELLRETILSYVVITRNQCLSPENAQTCRLVSKSWLSSVSRICRKTKLPLFALHFSESKSRKIDPYAYVYGNVAKFTEEFTGPLSSEQRVPPFKFTITAGYLQEENYASFYRCLKTCGDSLLKLLIFLPESGGSMTYIFPDLSLKSLHTFKVKLSNVGARDVVSLAKSNNATYLIQSIFQAAPNLKQFDLHDENLTGSYLVPNGFGHLKLPSSLTTLQFGCKVTPVDLEIIKNSELPNLKRLIITIVNGSFPDGLVFEVLQKVRATLEYFGLYQMTHFPPPEESHTYLRFPVMKKLTWLLIPTSLFELEPSLGKLEESFPVLRDVYLDLHTVPAFRKWINYSTFEFVTKLKVTLVEEVDEEEHEDYHKIDCGLETMQCIHRAFPNLKDFTVNFCYCCDQHFKSFKFLLQKMTKLENLKIEFYETAEISGSDFFDALLLGVPVEWVKALRNTSEDLWDQGEFEIKSGFSIKNLTNLQKLDLHAPHCDSSVNLISDVAFHFAFLQMPKLQSLIFNHGFESSPNMEMLWKEQGRKITEWGPFQ